MLAVQNLSITGINQLLQNVLILIGIPSVAFDDTFKKTYALIRCVQFALSQTPTPRYLQTIKRDYVH